MSNSRISDFLAGQNLVTVEPTASVKKAIKIMHAKDIGSVLVVREDKLQGIFTTRDIERLNFGKSKAKKTPVADVMTPDPETIPPDATISDALDLMAHGGFRHLPVLEDGRLVGIVARRDFF